MNLCSLLLLLSCSAVIGLCVLGDRDGNSALSLLMSFSGSSTSLRLRLPATRSRPVYPPRLPLLHPSPLLLFPVHRLFLSCSPCVQHGSSVPPGLRPSVDCVEPRQPLPDRTYDKRALPPRSQLVGSDGQFRIVGRDCIANFWVVCVLSLNVRPARKLFPRERAGRI